MVEDYIVGDLTDGVGGEWAANTRYSDCSAGRFLRLSGQYASTATRYLVPAIPLPLKYLEQKKMPR